MFGGNSNWRGPIWFPVNFLIIESLQKFHYYYGDRRMLQEDPHWREHVLFYEYSHGDHGGGLGANHQTGWTALVAKLLQQSGSGL